MPSTTGFTPLSYNSTSSSSSGSGPAYERVTSIPSWLPTERTRELEDQYRNTNVMFDNSEYDAGNRAQQSRVLTSATNSANAAAAEYANRARQAGGSGLGAGLVRAQAVTGAREVAGKMELERLKHDSDQREHAANYAATIANQLSTIRNQYLSSIVEYANATNRTNAEFTSREHATSLEEAKFQAAQEKLRGGPAFTVGSWNNNSSYNFPSMAEATRFFQEHQGQQTGYGYVPRGYVPWGG